MTEILIFLGLPTVGILFGSSLVLFIASRELSKEATKEYVAASDLYRRIRRLRERGER